MTQTNSANACSKPGTAPLCAAAGKQSTKCDWRISSATLSSDRRTALICAATARASASVSTMRANPLTCPSVQRSRLRMSARLSGSTTASSPCEPPAHFSLARRRSNTLLSYALASMAETWTWPVSRQAISPMPVREEFSLRASVVGRVVLGFRTMPLSGPFDMSGNGVDPACRDPRHLGVARHQVTVPTASPLLTDPLLTVRKSA